MERSIAAARLPDGGSTVAEARRTDLVGARGRSMLTGLLIVAAVILVYLVSNPSRPNLYAHFVWQASAWLEGQTAIRYPVAITASSPGNDYYQDVMPVLAASGAPTGRGVIPFPPLPAAVLLPFVAIWGLTTNAQLIATGIGALDVGLAFWALGRLRIRRGTRIAATLFFGLGTVLWYAAMLGTTWYLAHLVALGLILPAIGLAIRVEPAPDLDKERARTTPAASLVEPRSVLIGLLVGLACSARLTVAFGLPFFVLVSGGSQRRLVGLALGVALPLLGLVAYDIASTGHPFSPVYDYLYRLEALGYPALGYHPAWSIEDVRYLPQNLALMLLQGPQILPACVPPAAARGLFDAACPIARPDPVAMSLLLTSPGYLLALPALRLRWSRLTAGAVLAVIAIAVVNLMHFSQGWVQFGYRFSLDFAPFALLLVALGLERVRRMERPALTRLAAALLVVSVLVNAWGVAWGVILGW